MFDDTEGPLTQIIRGQAPRGPKVAFRLSLFLAGASCLLLAFMGYRYWRDYRSMVAEAIRQTRSEARRGSEDIATKLNHIASVAEDIAQDLSSGALLQDNLGQRLRQALRRDSAIFRIGAAFVPFAFAPDLRLYAPAYAVEGDQTRFLEMDSFYDYTDPQYDWYHAPLAVGATWLDPFFDETIGEIVVVYSTPFHLPESGSRESGPSGVLVLWLPASYLQTRLDILNLGVSGFGHIQSKAGNYVAHPTFDLVVRSATGNASGATLDSLDGTYSQLLTPIDSTEWTLAVTLSREDILKEPTALRRRLTDISIVAIVFLASTLFLVFRVYNLTESKLWVFSFITAALFSSGILCIWYLTLALPDPQGYERAAITNPYSLHQFQVNNTRQALLSGQQLPLYVPTALFVQSVTFDTAYDVQVTGYVWQKFYDGLHDDVERGFILPESRSGEVVEAYREKRAGVELYGWHFTVDLRQEFDYSSYPFGREDIWIKMWPKEFYRNVVLIPDLESYRFLRPSSKPGTRNDLILPGWIIDKSYFSFRSDSYTTNFGFEDYVGQEDFPELYFSLVVRRELIGPFVIYLLPVGVVVVLTFILLMVGRRAEDKMVFMGFSAMNVIASCSAFLLVVVFSHIDLRQTLGAKTIVYLEMFYFATYCIILAVSVNALVFAEAKSPVLRYRENLVPKVLYWPVIQLAMLIVTILRFY